MLLVALFLLLPACRQRMAQQPAYRPLVASDFFPDGRSARPVVAGTVARGQLRIDTRLYEGKDDKGDLVTAFPFTMTEEVLERGKERYNIFCSVCHGLTGNGDGRIVQRSFTKPPNYHADDSRYYKLRGKDIPLTKVAVGHIYDVITHGFGAMPDHASQIPVNDRWAIVGYVRALQLSQSPPDKRKALEEAWGKQANGEKK